MPLTNGFFPPADRSSLTTGAVVAGLRAGERFVGLVIEHIYSTGILILGEDTEEHATPRLIPIDEVEEPMVLISGDLRLEPIDGDPIGHLGDRKGKTNGMVRSMPDRSMRMWVVMSDGDGMWIDLATGDQPRPGAGGDVRQAAVFRSWELALYRGEGSAQRRTVLATHDYAP